MKRLLLIGLLTGLSIAQAQANPLVAGIEVIGNGVATCVKGATFAVAKTGEFASAVVVNGVKTVATPCVNMAKGVTKAIFN